MFSIKLLILSLPFFTAILSQPIASPLPSPEARVLSNTTSIAPRPRAIAPRPRGVTPTSTSTTSPRVSVVSSSRTNITDEPRISATTPTGSTNISSISTDQTTTSNTESKAILAELSKANPKTLSNPEILQDPNQPYLQLNHKLFSDERKGAVPTPAGEFLGNVGLETRAFRQKCFRCCKKTREAIETTLSWTTGCSICQMADVLPSSNCPNAKFLGYFYTPTDCFFERCHQMLLKATGKCICYWA